MMELCTRDVRTNPGNPPIVTNETCVIRDMTPEEAEAILLEWRTVVRSRDERVRAAVAVSLTKHRVSVLTGIGRSTIDRILRQRLKRHPMASIKKRTRAARRKDARTGQVREVEVEYWRARYRDDGGKEYVRHFDRRVDAQKWLDEVTTPLAAEPMSRRRRRG